MTIRNSSSSRVLDHHKFIDTLKQVFVNVIMPKQFDFIDLFAGIGGFHQALSTFGGNCVFASEWDKHAASTYAENYGITPYGDITQIDVNDIPPHQVLCAGFPCQAFSISGKQKGFQDDRGNLFFDIVRIAKHHQPKVLFLENVRNFERHDGGNTLRRVTEELDTIGYQVFHHVLNASHFGLPQNRERIYLICIRKDLQIQEFHFPAPTHQPCCLLDMIEENPSQAKIIDRPDTYFTKKSYHPELDDKGNLLLPNKLIQIGYVNKGGQGERIYSPFGHAVTLSAYGGGVGSKTGLYWIDEEIRKLSPRECARVQGFPDNFTLNPTTTHCYKQFGNSVAINVLKAVFREVVQKVQL